MKMHNPIGSSESRSWLC